MYGYRRYRSRRPYRRRYKRRYKRKGSSLSRRVAKIERDYKPEMKYFQRAEISYTSTANTAAEYSLWAGIAEGDTDSTYTGNRVRVKSIHIMGTVKNSGAGTTNRRYKLVLVKDKKLRDDAVVATWEQVYDQEAIVSFRNTDNVKRFQILGTREFTLITDEDGTTDDSRYVNWYTKCNFETLFEASDEDNAMSNDIVLMIIGDAIGQMNLKCRVRYTDN